MLDRLNNNIQILKCHNEKHIPVLHITDGRKHEIEVIDEICEDVSLILEKIKNNILIELPCKVGDTVYFANDSYHDSAEIDGIHIDANGISFTWVQYEYGVDITELWDEGDFDIEEIGKTVFLTRKEAEKALENWGKR